MEVMFGIITVSLNALLMIDLLRDRRLKRVKEHRAVSASGKLIRINGDTFGIVGSSLRFFRDRNRLATDGSQSYLHG
jgi:hypothetical protein